MFPSEADQAAIAERYAEYQAADRAALVHLVPGTYIQHTLYPHYRGIVADLRGCCGLVDGAHRWNDCPPALLGAGS